jgi:hypothetical protein
MPATRIGRKRSRHYAIRIGLVSLIMLDTFRRAFQKHDAFDYTMLAVEILVLGLIFYELASDRLHHWKINRHKKRLRPYYSTGLQFQHEFQTHWRHISSGIHAEGALAWVTKVESWINDTNALLNKYSPEAAIAFARDSTGHIMKYGNQSSTWASYARLEACLKNLHGIIEEAEFYL